MSLRNPLSKSGKQRGLVWQDSYVCFDNYGGNMMTHCIEMWCQQNLFI